MGKNDLKNKLKNASAADAARVSLFGSLDDYEATAKEEAAASAAAGSSDSAAGAAGASGASASVSGTAGSNGGTASGADVSLSEPSPVSEARGSKSGTSKSASSRSGAGSRSAGSKSASGSGSKGGSNASATPSSAPASGAASSAPAENTPADDDFAGDDDIFETYTRKTYFYTQPQIEAIRIMAFNSGLDISQVVRDIMDEAIPDDIMEQAIQRVRTGNIKKPRKKRKKL